MTGPTFSSSKQIAAKVNIGPVTKNEVHKGSCGECKQGHGRKGGMSVQNQWYAFETERAARRSAEVLAPLENSVCSKCVTGSYVRHRVSSRPG